MLLALADSPYVALVSQVQVLGRGAVDVDTRLKCKFSVLKYPSVLPCMRMIKGILHRFRTGVLTL